MGMEIEEIRRLEIRFTIKDFKNAVISKFKEIKPMIDKLGTTLEPFSKELESIKKSNSISKTGKYKNKN